MIWFVHASTGSDSNEGWRSDAPFLTLAKLATVMAPGDKAYLAGTFRENVTFSGLVDCYIGQWPGQTKYVVRGDTVITGFSASGSGYTKTLATGLNIKSVVVNWDTRVNQNGLHYGHLTLRADAATALSTANSWFYNSGTGVLSINTGANPATQTVAWCKGGVNGMDVGACTNTIIDNFKGALWVDSTANTGNALVGSGTGNVFRIDRTDDCGHRHVVFRGGSCSNNVIEPSTGGEGVCAGVASGGIVVVFSTTQASQAGNVCRNLRIWASPFLLSDAPGNTTSHSGTVSGINSHTDGVQLMDGVTWKNIRITYPYTVGSASSAMYASHTTAPTAAALSRTIPSSYGVQFIECRTDGAHSPGVIIGAKGSAVYQRCSFRLSQDRNQSPNAPIMSESDGVRKQVLFDACEFMYDLDGASTSLAFKPWNNEDFLFLNCSAVDRGTGSNTRHWFFANFMGTAPNNTVSLYGRQSIWFYTSTTAATRSFINNDGLNANGSGDQANGVVPRDFVDCVYGNISTGNFSSAANYNTEAEWTSAVDTTARYDATSPFEEPSVHCRLKRNHALWTHRDTSSTSNTALGINNKPWTGTLGCYQYNASATPNWPSLTGTPPPRINKPKMLIQFQTGATTNAYRIRQDLFDDPQGYIEGRLAKCETAGVRSVVFHTPGGHNATEYYPVYSLKDLPNHIRDTLVMCLDRWREDYGINHFGPYMGAVWYTEASGVTKPLMFPDWEDESVADLLDGWQAIGCDTVDLDATANRGNDLYSGAVSDQYDTLGGFAYHFVGMIPTGEAIPLDNPGSPTDFDAAESEFSEYLVTQEYYDDNAGLQAVLDATLPADRAGFHWIYYAAEFDTTEAQVRVNQGYIVGAWDDMAQADLNWIGSQTPTDIDPPVPPPSPKGRRSRRSTRSTRSQTGV